MSDGAAGERIVAIHQPNLVPRLSTLAKLYAADTWIVLDNVQFVRRDYQHRCRLGTPGQPVTRQWFTLPVHLPHGRSTSITEVRTVEHDVAARRFIGMLTQHYGRNPYWKQLRPIVHEIAEHVRCTSRLDDIAVASTTALLKLLGWAGRITRSSGFQVPAERSTRLAELAESVGGRTYLCGTGGARYLDATPFKDRSIDVRYIDVPKYMQCCWADARILTSCAAFSNHGITVTREFLREVQR